MRNGDEDSFSHLKILGRVDDLIGILNMLDRGTVIAVRPRGRNRSGVPGAVDFWVLFFKEITRTQYVNCDHQSEV